MTASSGKHNCKIGKLSILHKLEFEATELVMLNRRFYFFNMLVALFNSLFLFIMEGWGSISSVLTGINDVPCKSKFEKQRQEIMLQILLYRSFL